MASTVSHDNQNRKQEETVEFIQQNLKRLKINLTDFNEEKLEIIKAHALARSKKYEHNWTMHFEKGNSSSWKIINEFIANDLASLRVLRLSFSECQVNTELVQSILRLLEKNPQSAIMNLEFHPCCMIDHRDAKGLEEEIFQFLAISGLEGCKLAFYGKDQHKFNQMNFTFASGKTIHVRFGIPRWIGRKKERPDRHDVVPPVHTRRLIRMMNEVETLNELDLSEIHLSVDDIHQVCQRIMNRSVFSLNLGLWDVTNPKANEAVCNLIRNGPPSLKHLGLGSDFKSHPGLPLKVLGDALSSSLFLQTVGLVLDFTEYPKAIEYVEGLTQQIKYPNRLNSVRFLFYKLRPFDVQLNNRVHEVEKALITKLAGMQTPRVFVLVAMVYAVNVMKKDRESRSSMVNCPLAMLNVDLLRMLAVFVW